MDWRNRKYYLVDLSGFGYDMRMLFFKIAAPTLKVHAPYNHFKNGEPYDGRNTKHINNLHKWWRIMLSCRIEDATALEYELRKAKRNDIESDFLELSKEIYGQ